MINFEINYLNLKGKEHSIRFTAIPFQNEFLRLHFRKHALDHV